MQKVEFNYYVWKNHPERSRIQLLTRNGSPVTDFTDFTGKIKDTHQMQGVCDRDILSWDLDGNYSRSGTESGLDLFMIMPNEPEMWVNVYKFQTGQITCGKPYKSKASAIDALVDTDDREHIGTFKLVKQ